eukprot:sb/3478619/
MLVSICQSIGLTRFSRENCGQSIGLTVKKEGRTCQSIGLTLFSFRGARENCGQSIGLTGSNKEGGSNKTNTCNQRLPIKISSFLGNYSEVKSYDNSWW